jgi:YCII-related domain
MNAESSFFGPRAATIVGLGVGAVGIAILWAAGVEFPVYPPPGIVILIAGTAFVTLARWAWAPAVGAFLGLFVAVGFLIHDQAGLATRTRWLRSTRSMTGSKPRGRWVFAGGLASPNTATVIDNRGGEAMVTDGPFLESKKCLGGFWIIEAPDLDVALKLAAEGSKQCIRRVEMRPFL